MSPLLQALYRLSDDEREALVAHIESECNRRREEHELSKALSLTKVSLVLSCLLMAVATFGVSCAIIRAVTL